MGMRDDIGIHVVFQLSFGDFGGYPVIFSLGKSPSRCFTAHPVIFQFDTFWPGLQRPLLRVLSASSMAMQEVR